MNAVDLSPMHPGTWRGIFVERLNRLDIVGEEIWAVTISSADGAAQRWLFPDRPIAYQFALEQAEKLDLPLFDHSDPADIA